MAADSSFEHHGQSGEYVMLPSGQMVPAAEVVAPVEPAEPAKPAQPSKAKD
jgi:hypothetical protein